MKNIQINLIDDVLVVMIDGQILSGVNIDSVRIYKTGKYETDEDGEEKRVGEVYNMELKAVQDDGDMVAYTTLYAKGNVEGDTTTIPGMVGVKKNRINKEELTTQIKAYMSQPKC